MSSVFTSTWTLRKCLRVLGVGILIGITLIYVLFQARNLIQGPAIILTDTYTPVHQDKIITLSGKAENIVKLTLNGKEIHTDAEGVFSHDVVLERGYTIVTLAAQDRFGRSTSVVREYVYVPLDSPEGGV